MPLKFKFNPRLYFPFVELLNDMYDIFSLESRAAVLQYRFAPDSSTFFKCLSDYKTQREIVRDIAREVDKISNGAAPILFHGFSNGGIFKDLLDIDLICSISLLW